MAYFVFRAGGTDVAGLYAAESIVGVGDQIGERHGIDERAIIGVNF